MKTPGNKNNNIIGIKKLQKNASKREAANME